MATHHISGAYASLQLRRPEILRCHGEHFNDLADCCALADCPRAIVEALELQFYPDFVDFHTDPLPQDSRSRRRLLGSVPHKLVDAVIYRRHLDLQYMTLPEAVLSKRGKPRVHQTEHDPEDNNECPLNAVAYEHFRTTFQNSRFYSVRRQAWATANPTDRQEALNRFFLPIQAVLNGGAVERDQGKLKDVQLELTGCEHGLPLTLADGNLKLNFHDESEDYPIEVPSMPESLDAAGVRQAAQTEYLQQSEYVFFRVVDARPSRRKRMRTDLMKAISPSHLAVSLHDVVHCDAQERTVTVSLSPSGSPGSGLAGSVSRLFDGMADIQTAMVWEVEQDVVWLWKGHERESWLNSGAVPKVLGMLFEAKAWEGVASLPVSEDQAETLSTLQALEEAGLVRLMEPDGEHQRWQLCHTAASSPLRCGVRLCRASDALQVRPDQPVMSMTMWELLRVLRDDGFEELPFTQGVEAFNVTRNAPKKLYSIGSKWCRAYLQVLVGRRELQQHGIKVVQHGCKASVYKAMLEASGMLEKSQRRSKRLNFADAEGLIECAVPGRGNGPSRKGPLQRHFGARVPAPAGGVADGSNAEPPPPTPEGAQVERRRGPRARHAKTHAWPHEDGPCLLICKGNSSWQATCPRSHSHRNPDKPSTKCTRTMSYTTDGSGLSEEDVLRLLRYWLVSCLDYATRTEHMKFKPSISDLPGDVDAFEVEAAQKLPSGYTSAPEGRAHDASEAPAGAPRRRVRRKAASAAAAAKAAAVPEEPGPGLAPAPPSAGHALIGGGTGTLHCLVFERLLRCSQFDSFALLRTRTTHNCRIPV